MKKEVDTEIKFKRDIWNILEDYGAEEVYNELMKRINKRMREYKQELIDIWD